MISWLATVLTLLGFWLNANRKLATWPILIFSNIAWVIALHTNLAAVFLNITLAFINIYGLWKALPSTKVVA